MPAKETVLAYLGHPDEGIVTPTPEQAVLFGETRRRVPRWLDPEAPALFGAKLDGATFPLGAAARRAYAAGPLSASLGEAFDTLRPLTGRGLGPVVGETVGASLVLIYKPVDKPHGPALSAADTSPVELHRAVEH